MSLRERWEIPLEHWGYWSAGGIYTGGTPTRWDEPMTDPPDPPFEPDANIAMWVDSLLIRVSADLRKIAKVRYIHWWQTPEDMAKRCNLTIWDDTTRKEHANLAALDAKIRRLHAALEEVAENT